MVDEQWYIIEYFDIMIFFENFKIVRFKKTSIDVGNVLIDDRFFKIQPY